MSQVISDSSSKFEIRVRSLGDTQVLYSDFYSDPELFRYPELFDERKYDLLKRNLLWVFFDILFGKRTTVKAHILDPNHGYYVANWIVGKDIKKEDMTNFVTSSADLYVAVYYEHGDQQFLIVQKDVWERQRAIFDRIESGDDYQEAMDEQLRDIESRIKSEESGS